MMNFEDTGINKFLDNGFDLKSHLASFLNISIEELELRLTKGKDDLAALHPGSFNLEDATEFYEDQVGNAHLFDLAEWHLNSASYIADTLRLQNIFATGHVLDFGGGIGTHSLYAASLKEVKHVWFVDLNPQNRDFVQQRAKRLGLENLITVHRDLESTGKIKFDTLICFDVLEHLPDPSEQLNLFLKRLSPSSISLMNWYFFKGNNNEYPFHVDDKELIEKFFFTLQDKYIEVFHPYLITSRAYKIKQ